jgi:hypothetical protein
MEHWAEHEHAALVPCGDRCGQHSGSGGRLHRGEHDDVGGGQCHWRRLRTDAYGNSNGYAYADSYADCDSNGFAYADGYADRDSDGHAYTDSYGYCDSNGYAYTDSYGYCDSNSYAYTDSYGYCDSNGYAYTDCDSNRYTYTDTYAYVDGYGPAETNPDTRAKSDTAASPIGAIRKRLCGNSRESLASSQRGEQLDSAKLCRPMCGRFVP